MKIKSENSKVHHFCESSDKDVHSDSLLQLLGLLLGLLGIRDDEVDGIFRLLQQNSQFRLNLLGPGGQKAEVSHLLVYLSFNRGKVSHGDERMSLSIFSRKTFLSASDVAANFQRKSFMTGQL